MRCVYCRECHYPLANLKEHRCPECGREFDPGNRCTYSVTLPPEGLHFYYITLLVCALGVMSYAATMFYVANPTSVGEFIGLLLFSCIVTLLYVAPLVVIGYVMRRHRLASLIVLTGAILISITGSLLIVDAMFINRDAQSPIALVTVPAMQMLATFGVGIVAWVFQKVSRSKESSLP